MLKNHPISAPITNSWNHYKNCVKASRNKTNPKNIHDLRVATQKLEAILKVSRGLLLNHHSKELIESLQKTRKQLGPLRDLQIASKSGPSKTKGFSEFVSSEKKKAQKKAFRHLKNISLKSEKHQIKKIISKELVVAENKKSVKQMHDLLDPEVQSTLLRFNAALANTTPKKMKNLHKFRILAKQLRYQEEVLKNIFGSTPFNLPKLKTVQEAVGKIQDSNALLQNMDRYLSHKKNRNDSKLLAKKKKIEKDHKLRIQTEFKKLSTAQWAN